MASAESHGVRFIDIRQDKTIGSLSQMMMDSLTPKDGSSPSLPTLLLYDEKGLRLFEDITYLDEYYLTNAEIETLSLHADRIVAQFPSGSRLVELGSGNLRKVEILLQACERAQKHVEYYALDLSLAELKRTFSEIDPKKHKYVSLNALHGTYDDALIWLKQADKEPKPTCVMSLGSSIGNFTRDEGAGFLRGFKDALQPNDWILVGLDACQNKQRVFTAYNDSQGVTEQFYRNGLDHANRLLGYNAFEQEQWAVEGLYNDTEHRHQAAYIARTDVDNKTFKFGKGQRIHLEVSYKYSKDQSNKLWYDSGLIQRNIFSNKAEDYNIHLLSPSTINFADKPSEYASQPVPIVDDWRRLWSAWDTVTLSMVPQDELMNKPIKLRNDLIFYLGHIPTFADIRFTRATGQEPTDPATYRTIFERGVDPDVDNPEICHNHSEIPDTWPPLENILDYSQRVRSRIIESVKSGLAVQDRKLGRSLWLAYEHEAMHLETFLYMLLQSSRALPPPGGSVPDFNHLARTAQSQREENGWHQIPASEVSIGLDDPENDLGPDRYFGWDNERPSRRENVKEFRAQSRHISNGEYAKFLEDTNKDTMPSGWITHIDTGVTSREANRVNNDDLEGPGLEGPSTASAKFISDKAVRTVYGPVPLRLALDWPVMASYDELAAYATWADARIPTLEELRSIYQFVESQKQLKAAQRSNTLISAVNGHLCNDGVEETPPSDAYLSSTANGASLDPNNLFVELTNCNVGFKTWHPTAITAEGDRLRGQSDAGGCWEWTSSALARYEGFKPMDLYPEYTADFFDDKHHIVLGGSWGTVPRIAGRKSFVNWYRRNYPYTWATVRLVRDH